LRVVDASGNANVAAATVRATLDDLPQLKKVKFIAVPSKHSTLSPRRAAAAKSGKSGKSKSSSSSSAKRSATMVPKKSKM
jgi:hypothetical protein